MSEHNCASCRFRAKYDQNPRSLLGRIWRWHATWCPGWKNYIGALPAEQRTALTARYNLNDGKQVKP
jgi:hypothetical protein